MSSRNLLLVEGMNDLHVIYSLSNYYQLPKVFEVKDGKGIDSLLNGIKTYLKQSELERIGVIIDADDGVKERWEALSNRLNNIGYKNIPSKPTIDGTILKEGDKPIFGIWIMPDNQLPGALEDFIGQLVPNDDALWKRACQVVADIPPVDRRFPISRYSKAYIHTWLAWQEEPGKPLGQAINARYLNPESPSAQAVIHWIKKLFDIVEEP